MSDKSVAAYLTMTGKIHVIVGQSGQYSDHSVWNVIAFETKNEADLHVLALEERMKELNFDSDEYLDYKQEEARDEKMKDLDPYFSYGNDEVTYGVESLCFGSFGERKK